MINYKHCQLLLPTLKQSTILKFFLLALWTLLFIAINIINYFLDLTNVKFSEHLSLINNLKTLDVTVDISVIDTTNLVNKSGEVPKADSAKGQSPFYYFYINYYLLLIILNDRIRHHKKITDRFSDWNVLGTNCYRDDDKNMSLPKQISDWNFLIGLRHQIPRTFYDYSP